MVCFEIVPVLCDASTAENANCHAGSHENSPTGEGWVGLLLNLLELPKETAKRSSVSKQRKRIMPFPCLTSSGCCLVESVSFAQSTRLLPGGSETTRLAMLEVNQQRFTKGVSPARMVVYLVNGLHNPINPRIATNGFVLRIHKNDFKVFVGRVLVDPVRIENSQIGAATANTFFSSRLERTLVLELIDTLVRWFA